MNLNILIDVSIRTTRSNIKMSVLILIITIALKLLCCPLFWCLEMSINLAVFPNIVRVLEIIVILDIIYRYFLF